MSSLKFKLIDYADVSTAYLEEDDLDLLSDEDCPTRFAELDSGQGTFHWVSPNEATWQGEVEEMRDFGLSERFIAILEEARAQHIQYVRFDADGGDVDGLTPVDEEETAGGE